MENNFNFCVEPTMVGMPEVVIGQMLLMMNGDDIYCCMQLSHQLKESIIRIMQTIPGFVIENSHDIMSDEAYICFDRLKIPMNLKIERVVIPGNYEWTKLNNKYHSFDDKPAYYDVDSIWYKYGRKHRDNNLPAFISIDGLMTWMKEGKIHRDNLPAEVDYDEIRYYQNGLLHRDGGLPAIIHIDGGKEWYLHGVLQRKDFSHKLEDPLTIVVLYALHAI